LENIHSNNEATVIECEERPWIVNAPKPLITSTLQQEASASYKITPKNTMKIAQALYEAGHITYMRTDFAILSKEAIEAAKEENKTSWGDTFIGVVAKAKAKDKAKDKATTSQVQEAHEAIRPTHFENHELPEDWTEVDKKIYSLIWRRAVQSVMAAAKGRTRSVKIHLKNDVFPWSAHWKTTDFLGWQIAGMPVNLDDTQEEFADSWKEAQGLKLGTKLTWESIQAAPKRSRALPRFTEATLIRELEKKGIGRPSTFASLVEILTDKKYTEKKDIPGTKINHTILTIYPNEWPPLTQITQVALGSEKQKLVPTALGESVLTFCVKEFPQLFAYEFTSQMENRLDLVSKGEGDWKQLCRDTWGSYKADHDRLKDKASLPSASDKVRDFGNGFKAVMSKNGPVLVQESADSKTTFYPFPPNTTIQTITEEEARAAIKEDSIGTWEGKPIVKKKGPYGEYLQWGDHRIPFTQGDTLDQILIKLSQKTNTHKFGPYTFGRGQYGPYMYKTDLKTKVFIGIPPTVDPKNLTAAEADALYKNGMEAKKRGGFRGRGRGH